MAGINFIGSYSGIDQSTIDQLMEVERLPLTQFNTKKTSITEQQNAWKDINTRLNNLFEKIKVLQSSDTFTSKTSTSTNQDLVSVSPSKDAVEGTYKINVEQLATSANIIGGRIPSSALDEDGRFKKDGHFTIKNHDGIAYQVEITTEDSLQSLVDKINAGTKNQIDSDTKKPIEGTGTGINASIIDGRLVLTDTKTGDRNIGLIDDGEGALVDLGLNSAVRQVNVGENSVFTINGVEVTRDSNSISDVVEGLTISLKKIHEEGQSDTVTIGLDSGKTTKAIQDFVDQYNSTMQFIEDKLAAGDPEIPGSAGTLTGDGSLMRLHSSLRNLVTSSLNTDAGYSDISQLGVSTIDRFGKLQFDTTKFNKALEENPKGVMNFFYDKDEEGNDIGFVSGINSYIDSFISTNNGIIKNKNETYDKAIKDINKQIETFNARMEKKEQQYIRRFTALDVAMMQAESQMTWLQGQVDAMNGIKR